MAYHRDHQSAGPGCFAGTAATLWRYVDARRLTAVLAQLPAGARSFWSV